MDPTNAQYDTTVHQAMRDLPSTGSDLVPLVIFALAILVAGFLMWRALRGREQ